MRRCLAALRIVYADSRGPALPPLLCKGLRTLRLLLTSRKGGGRGGLPVVHTHSGRLPAYPHHLRIPGPAALSSLAQSIGASARPETEPSSGSLRLRQACSTGCAAAPPPGGGTGGSASARPGGPLRWVLLRLCSSPSYGESPRHYPKSSGVLRGAI